MSDAIYGIRCHRCLWSVLGPEPRTLAVELGVHRCDPAQVRYVATLRALPAFISNNTEGNHE